MPAGPPAEVIAGSVSFGSCRNSLNSSGYRFAVSDGGSDGAVLASRANGPGSRDGPLAGLFEATRPLAGAADGDGRVIVAGGVVPAVVPSGSVAGRGGASTVAGGARPAGGNVAGRSVCVGRGRTDTGARPMRAPGDSSNTASRPPVIWTGPIRRAGYSLRTQNRSIPSVQLSSGPKGPCLMEASDSDRQEGGAGPVLWSDRTIRLKRPRDDESWVCRPPRSQTNRSIVRLLRHQNHPVPRQAARDARQQPNAANLSSRRITWTPFEWNAGGRKTAWSYRTAGVVIAPAPPAIGAKHIRRRRAGNAPVAPGAQPTTRARPP